MRRPLDGSIEPSRTTRDAAAKPHYRFELFVVIVGFLVALPISCIARIAAPPHRGFCRIGRHAIKLLLECLPGLFNAMG
jgi:hypothetical protein